MLQLNLNNNKMIREFLKNYAESKWNKLVPSLLEIAILNLYKSFKKYVFTEEEIQSIISTLKNNLKINTQTKKFLKETSSDYFLNKHLQTGIKLKNLHEKINNQKNKNRSLSKHKNINEMDVSSNNNSLNKIQINNFNKVDKSQSKSPKYNTINYIENISNNHSQEKKSNLVFNNDTNFEKEKFKNEDKLIVKYITSANEIKNIGNNDIKRNNKISNGNNYLNINDSIIKNYTARNNNDFCTISYNNLNSNQKSMNNLNNKYANKKREIVKVFSLGINHFKPLRKKLNIGSYSTFKQIVPVKINEEVNYSFNNLNINKISKNKLNEFFAIKNNNNDNDINVAKIDDETGENFHIIMNNKVSDYISKKIKKIQKKEENFCEISRKHQLTEINYNTKLTNKNNYSNLLLENYKINDNEHYYLTNKNSKRNCIQSDRNKFTRKNRVINYNQENRSSSNSNSKINIISKNPFFLHKNMKFKRSNDKLQNKTSINNNL